MGCNALSGLSMLESACATHAKSSVTIYGMADALVRYASGLNAAYSRNSGVRHGGEQRHQHHQSFWLQG